MELQRDPELSRIPVFVMTSLADDPSKSDQEWAEKLGVVRFFSKPFNPEILADCAAELLGITPQV